MALQVLQAIINHCARAQDLLVQSLVQWSIQLAIVAEPYSIPTRDNWVADNTRVVALVTQVTAGSPPFSRVEKGAGCVAALVGKLIVVGVYLSPNRILAEFEEFLIRLGEMVERHRPAEVLVAGDLNANSSVWGSAKTDVRGVTLAE